MGQGCGWKNKSSPTSSSCRDCIASSPSHSLCSHKHPQETCSTSECATEFCTSPHSVTLCCTALFHISPDTSDCVASCCALKNVQMIHLGVMEIWKRRETVRISTKCQERHQSGCHWVDWRCLSASTSSQKQWATLGHCWPSHFPHFPTSTAIISCITTSTWHL